MPAHDVVLVGSLDYYFNPVTEAVVAKGHNVVRYNMPADFKFILLNSRVAIDDSLTPLEQFVVKGYRLIKSISLSTAEDFGLELTNVEEEKVPISLKTAKEIKLQRV